MYSDVADLPLHRKQLYRNLRLQGPAFQYLHSSHGSLVSRLCFSWLPKFIQWLIQHSLRNIGSFDPDKGAYCRLTT